MTVTTDIGHTFIHPNGRDSSTIDFFFLYKQKCEQKVVKICGRTDFIENVLDHYPVTLSYVLDFTKSEPKDIQYSSFLRINWKKVDKDDYVKNITSKLDEFETKMNLISDLNERVHEKNSVIIESAKECVPLRKRMQRKPKLKVMTPSIKEKCIL